MTKLSVLMLAFLAGCSASGEPSPAPAPPPSQTNADPVLDRPDASSGPRPCERTEIVWVGRRRVGVPLPCRPFDPKRDAPDPPDL